MNQLSDFTKKAMEMAREQIYQEDNSVPDKPTREPDRHNVNLYLSDEDMQLLYRLLDLGISKSKEAITRAQRFPSETIRSSMTIERHEAIIDHIETLRSHITENAQW